MSGRTDAGGGPSRDTRGGDRITAAPFEAGRGTTGAAHASRAVTGADLSTPDARRPVRAPVTRRPACLGVRGARPVGRRARGRTRAERLWAGAAVTLCSATVVVLLGMVADLAAGAHEVPDTPPVSISVSP